MLRETFKKVRRACVGVALPFTDAKGDHFICFGSGGCVHASGIIVTAKHVVTSYYEKIKKEVMTRTAPSKPEFIFTVQEKDKRNWVRLGMLHMRLFL